MLKETYEAVNRLLVETDPNVCINTLDEFFECWLTHERTDSESASERADRFQAYKSLRKMLEDIDSTNAKKE